MSKKLLVPEENIKDSSDFVDLIEMRQNNQSGKDSFNCIFASEKESGLSHPEGEITLYNMYKAYNLTDEEAINKFFINMRKRPMNKDNYIRDFDEYYFRARPKFSPKLIRMFL